MAEQYESNTFKTYGCWNGTVVLEVDEGDGAVYVFKDSDPRTQVPKPKINEEVLQLIYLIGLAVVSVALIFLLKG